jgi:sugar lactone lactonase YvrE
VDSAGNVYVADTYNNVVEKITPAGALSIIAGTGTAGNPTEGPATSEDLDEPTGVAVDANGDVYVGLYGSCEVVKVTPSGTLSRIAGNGTCGAPKPGPAVTSSLGEVWGVVVDASGNVYIADDTEQVIEKVTPSGTLSIFAGTGSTGYPTAGPARSSDLEYPTGIAIDAAGNVYLADYDSAQILKFTPSGTLSIIAGDGSFAAPTDGPATSSALDAPFGVAVDGAGDVYVADTFNDDVEEVTPDGTLSIIAGDGGEGAPTYGGPATSSDLEAPADIASTPAGRLYVADTYNDTIDLLEPPAPEAGAVPTVTGTTTVGETLTASEGTFTNSPVTYTYQWEDCDATGADCTLISGATSSQYILTASDAGHTVRVIVTASNGGGSTTSTSAPTALIAGLTVSTLPAVVASPSNAFTIVGVRAQPNGTAVVTLSVPGPGELDLLGTHEQVGAAATAAALSPGYDRIAWGRSALRLPAAGRFTITVGPNATGRRLLARHREHGWALNVMLWTTYTPAQGKPRALARNVKVLSAVKRHH